MFQKEDFNLRLLTETDLNQVLNWRNSDRIRMNMYSDHIITLDEHLYWYKKLQTDLTSLCLIFEYRKQPIGVVNVTNIDKKNKRCYWGFYLGEENTPAGCGMMMGFYALNFIFLNLEIHKLCGEVFAFNQSSWRYHQRLGFVEEGRFQEHYLKNGKYEDIICLALFDRVWETFKNEIAAKYFGSDNIE